MNKNIYLCYIKDNVEVMRGKGRYLLIRMSGRLRENSASIVMLIQPLSHYSAVYYKLSGVRGG